MKVRTTGSSRPTKTVSGAVARKELIGAIEFMRADQDVSSPAFDRLAAAFGSDVVGDGRAEIAAQRARGRGDDQVELSDRHQITGERHDHFGRQRNACRLDRHEEDDTEIAGSRNDLDDPGRERRYDLIKHCWDGKKRGGDQRRLRARRPSSMTILRRGKSSGSFFGTFSAMPRSRSRRSISFQTSSGRMPEATHSTTRL